MGDYEATESTDQIKSLQPNHEGEDYRLVLSRIHKALRPASYLEIGTRDGSSLALASCPSIAIDPEFRLLPNFLGEKTFCGFYQMKSDAFFESFNPTAILGRRIDMAFLDGLHLAEFLLRDFINVERFCKPNSVIAIHDCLPLDVEMTRRHEHSPNEATSALHPGWWTGDVWKTIAVLRKYRPDLQILILNAQPTGLALITGLDSNSSILFDSYFPILAELRSMRNNELDLVMECLDTLVTQKLMTLEDISQYFWL